MKSKAAILLAALAAVTILCASAPAQEEEIPTTTKVDEEAEIIRKEFRQGCSLFLSVDQPQSIPIFISVIDGLEAARLGRPLSDEEGAILEQSMEYCGRAYYNNAEKDHAANMFTRLIALNPDYVIKREEASTKLIRFYDGLISDLTGVLSILSTPPGAAVKIDGSEAGRQSPCRLRLLAGSHSLELIRHGYRVDPTDVEIKAGETAAVNISMERIYASCRFVTVPDGVEVWVDGVKMGETAPLPGAGDQDNSIDGGESESGGAGPSGAVEGDLLVPELTVGVHRIFYRKECFIDQEAEFDVPEPGDFVVDRVVMAPSVGAVTIDSAERGAYVYIDGREKGQTPLMVEGLCTGKHEVFVKKGREQERLTVVVERGKVVAISVDLKPAATYIGPPDDAPIPPAIRERFDGIAMEAFSSLGSLAVAGIGAEKRAMLEETIQSLLQELASYSKTDGGPEAIQTRQEQARTLIKMLVEDLVEKLETDLLILCNVVSKGLQERTFILYLLSPHSGSPDIFVLAGGAEQNLARLAEMLDRVSIGWGRWIGAWFVDSGEPGGPVCVRLCPEGAATAAGLRIGSRISAVKGVEVKGVSDMGDHLSRVEPGEEIEISVTAMDDQRSTKTVRVEPLAKTVPLQSSELVYNRVMIELAKEIRAGSEGAGLARLNLAICHMHFGDWSSALQVLEETGLPAARGFSEGTLSFYRGLCRRELGQTAGAIEDFRSAASAREATILSEAGLPLAPLAEFYIKALEGE